MRDSYRPKDGLVNGTAWGLIGIGILLAILSSAKCSPISASTTYKPQHHNIPATFAQHPEGPIVWMCATQPRPYDVHGRNVMEEDHYLQYEPCPQEPIR